MQGPEHPESSTTRPKQPPGQAGRYQQSQTAILLSWLSGIGHSDRSAPTPGRGNGRVLRDEGSLVHVSRSDMSSHTDLLQQSLILHKERLLPCQREQSCLNCLCSGREPHPLLSPSKPTGSHTKAWSGQNKPTNINPCSKSTSFLYVSLSQVPLTRPQQRPASCQHKACASVKQQTQETWGELGQEGP